MSISYHTKARIPRSFFPAIGKTALLGGRPVIARNYDGEKDKDATSFLLVDRQGYEMGLYFKVKEPDGELLLDFFDVTAGNWTLEGEDALWMRKAVLAAVRRKVKALPPGPARMPKPKQPRMTPTEAAFHSIRDLSGGDTLDTIFLPTRALTVSPDEFKAALERHGLTVTQVEGRKAFKVQGTDLSVDWNGYSSNFYDRYDWTEVDKTGPPTRLGELRILPYAGGFDGWIAIWFTRPVLPTDDLKRTRTQAWPLMESRDEYDEPPSYIEVAHEKALAEDHDRMVQGLKDENAKLRWQMGQLQKDIDLLTACLVKHRIRRPSRPLEVMPDFNTGKELP